MAPTAAAAQVLATETTMPADTLDKLLYEHTPPDRSPQPPYDLPRGSTVIVDEAGTVSTPKLATLTRLADMKRWRVVMVGDPRQFSAVGRGGILTHLIDTCGAIELDHIHRFTHHWERNASRRLRNGDVTVLAEYGRHGRLHDGTPDTMEAAIVEAWYEAQRRGETVVLMANTNHTVHRLNQLIQQRRIDAGELDPNGPALDPARELLVGDEVVTRRNQRTLLTDHGVMVKNRDHWTIEAIHPDGAVTVTGESGRVRLPADYTAEELELGYAQTSHATQGRTVDTGLLLVDGPIDGRGLCTPLTRGRHTNHAYVVTNENETATDVLTQAITRDWIDEPAITRRTRIEADRELTSSLGRSKLGDDQQAATHPPDHSFGKPNLSSDEHQIRQKINQSIEAARQRHNAERARSRHTPDIGR